MTTLDLAARQKGTEVPFEPHEGDHTSFVHVLWDARRQGLTLDKDADEIVSMLLRSRAMVARTAEAIARHDRELERADLLRRAGGLDGAAAVFQKEADQARRTLAQGGHHPKEADGLHARASRNDARAQQARDHAAALREQAR